MKTHFKPRQYLTWVAVIGLLTFFTLDLQANCDLNSHCEVDWCPSECPESEFYFLFENVIVKPYFSRNNAYFLEDPPGNPGQVGKQFDWGYRYSPRIELGWLNEKGTGFRGRYWRFHHSVSLNAEDPNGDIAVWFGDDSIDGIGFDGASEAFFKHSLELDVVDFEAIFHRGCWTYSAGGRYARMDQHYIGKERLVSVPEELEAKHNYEGVGLTLGAEFFQPWCWGLSFFTKSRASLLYGHSGFKAFDPNDDDQIRNSNDHDVFAIGDLQLGFDWRKTICNQCAYLRFALEAQYWVSAGAGGPGNNAVFDEGNYQNSHPQDSHLGLFGFNIGFGVLF